MLVLGIIIGAGLIFGTIYSANAWMAKLSTDAQNQTTTEVVTIFVTNVATGTSAITMQTSPIASSSQVSLSAVICYIGGGVDHEVNSTYSRPGCLLQLSNEGGSTGTIKLCTFNGTNGGIGVLESDGSPASITLKPGLHPTAYCQAPSNLDPIDGTVAYGSLYQGNTGTIPFSGTWQ